MNRRDFLATSAATITGAALAPSVLAARATVRQPATGASAGVSIRKACKIGMIGAGDTLAEKFAIARDAGFEGVELNAPSDVDLEEAIDAAASAGIEIPGVVDSVHWGKPLSHPDASVRAEGFAGLERAISDFAAVGGSTALLVPAVVNGGVSYSEAWERSIKEIQRAVPIAREQGVKIALENVWNNFLLSPVEAARYVDACNDFPGKPRSGQSRGDTVGWYFDIGNIWHYGWPQHWIEALGHRIMRLDVKGYSRAISDKQGKWAGFGVKIGDGDIPWPEVNAALREIGYRGWATAEVSGGDLAHLTDVADRMDDVFGR